jgi:hypothetical protein
MNNRFTNYMLAGAATLLLLLFGGSFIPGLSSQPDSLACGNIEYIGIAPEVPEGSVAMGPSIETRVTGFEALSAADKVEAVKKDGNEVGCQYASQAYTQAIHRGILPWPTSDKEWTDQLLKIDGDRKVHHDLMRKVSEWKAEASAEVLYLDTPYTSDWLVRIAGDEPLLRQGPGHADVAGWVVKWTHANADGTTSVVIERLVCMYQWVGEIPPSVPPCDCPPPPPPPCPPPVGVPADKWDPVKCRKLTTSEEDQQNGDTGVGQEPQNNDTSGVDVGPTKDSDGTPIPEPPLQPVVTDETDPTPGGSNSGSDGPATDEPDDTGQGGEGNGEATNPFG